MKQIYSPTSRNDNDTNTVYVFDSNSNFKDLNLKAESIKIK